MRKSTLFISAMLTVFLMATLFGVISAYQNIVTDNQTVAVTPAELSVQQPASTAVPTIVSPMVISPEQATTIAVELLGDSSVYSVEVVDYEGIAAYLVTFSAGDLVYVSSTGEVLAVTKLEPVVVVVPAGNRDDNGERPNRDQQQQEDNGDDDHEDGDEHEDGDD